MQLIPIVSFLRTLPLPATHLNHLAALSVQSILRNAQHSYGEMRGGWSRKCFKPHAKRLFDRSKSVDGVLAGREIGTWVENMLMIAGVCLYIFIFRVPYLTREIRRNTIFYPISHQFLHRRWLPLVMSSWEAIALYRTKGDSYTPSPSTASTLFWLTIARDLGHRFLYHCRTSPDLDSLTIPTACRGRRKSHSDSPICLSFSQEEEKEESEETQQGKGSRHLSHSTSHSHSYHQGKSAATFVYQQEQAPEIYQFLPCSFSALVGTRGC